MATRLIGNLRHITYAINTLVVTFLLNVAVTTYCFNANNGSRESTFATRVSKNADLLVSLEEYVFKNHKYKLLAQHYSLYNLNINNGNIKRVLRCNHDCILPSYNFKQNCVLYLRYRQKNNGDFTLKLIIYNLHSHIQTILNVPKLQKFGKQGFPDIDGSDIKFSWSPDGKLIAVLLKNGVNSLFIFNGRTLHLRSSYPRISSYRWAPTGSRLIMRSPTVHNVIFFLSASLRVPRTIKIGGVVVSGCFLSNNDILICVRRKQSLSPMGHFGKFVLINLLTGLRTIYYLDHFPSPAKSIHDRYIVFNGRYDMNIDDFDTVRLFALKDSISTCIIQFRRVMSNGSHYTCFLWDFNNQTIKALGDAKFIGYLTNTNSILLISNRWFGPYNRNGGAYLTTLWLENLSDFNVRKVKAPYFVQKGVSLY